jgi:hypothetical protein
LKSDGLVVHSLESFGGKLIARSLELGGKFPFECVRLLTHVDEFGEHKKYPNLFAATSEEEVENLRPLR